MTGPGDRTFELKAAALVWSSPFAAHHPSSMGSWREKVEAWLSEQEIVLSDAERTLLESCEDEAHDAASGPSKGLRGTGVPRGSLVHPLSATPLPVSAEIQRLLHAPLGYIDSLVGELRQLRREHSDLRAWYRALWHKIMRDPLYAALPADGALPDHSVAAHRSMTAALVGARHGGSRPALLAMHVGPVQSFISAARRTHDLATGSFTIGYLAFSGAVALAKELGPDVLLNPDVSHRALADHLLFACSSSSDKPVRLRSALMNRTLALIPESVADDAARRMTQAISDRWLAMGDAACKACDIKDTHAFFSQMKRHLELDAVVLPWPDDFEGLGALLGETGDAETLGLHQATYPSAAFGKLADLTERAVTAHRISQQGTAAVGDQRPKCTNCGLREQVGKLSDDPTKQQHESHSFFRELSQHLCRSNGNERRTSLQLTMGEGLCAVCLTKRLAAERYFGDNKTLGLDWNEAADRRLLRFPSTATLASAPLRFSWSTEASASLLNGWLDHLDALHDRAYLDFTPPGCLLEHLESTPTAIGSNRLLCEVEGAWFYEPSYAPRTAWRNHFPEDPQGQEEVLRFSQVKGKLHEAVKGFRGLRAATKKSASEYYAVIVLDGDRMGDWKAGRHEHSPTYGEIGEGIRRPGELPRPVHPALYAELSRRLARANQALHEAVERHLGRLVYHGGDDVLAFVPLATALSCLGEIRNVLRQTQHLGERVTFSAGVAIGHWKAPLSGMLHEARAAEARAKKDRDCFGITLEPHSGERIELTLPWVVPAEAPTTASLEVIPLLYDLLAAHSESVRGAEASLARSKAGFSLREELPMLARRDLRDALILRTHMLLFGAAEPSSSPHGELQRRFDRFLDHVIPDELHFPEADTVGKGGVSKRESLEADEPQLPGADTVVQLLLMFRFLRNQERGVDTATLLRQLGLKEAA